jgi:hypothetical protein
MEVAMKTLLTLAVGLVLIGPARAEYRVVLIRVAHAKDGKEAVTIRSDAKADRREAVSVDEACKAIKQMTGWGSAVGVFVVSDRGLAGPEAKKLLGTILDNWQLTLVSLGQEVPKGLPAEWLKTVGEKR